MKTSPLRRRLSPNGRAAVARPAWLHDAPALRRQMAVPVPHPARALLRQGVSARRAATERARRRAHLHRWAAWALVVLAVLAFYAIGLGITLPRVAGP